MPGPKCYFPSTQRTVSCTVGYFPSTVRWHHATGVTKHRTGPVKKERIDLTCVYSRLNITTGVEPLAPVKVRLNGAKQIYYYWVSIIINYYCYKNTGRPNTTNSGVVQFPPPPSTVMDRVTDRDRDMGRVRDRVRLTGLAIAAPSYSGP